jgi:hypothetical protein
MKVWDAKSGIFAIAFASEWTDSQNAEQVKSAKADGAKSCA